MSDQHSQRAASLEARLTDVKMEIDDDDEDVVLAIVTLTNEAAIPMGGLEIKITTSDGLEVSAKEGITSLSPGVTRTFTFEFPLENGQWTFSTTSSGKKISLGPYDADFTYQEDKGRKLNNAIGSNLFHGAFTEHLNDFGNTEEREIIDSSSVVLTTYHGENAEGGATKINVGVAAEEEEESPRTPPWESSSTEESVPDPLSAPLNPPTNEVRTPPWENNGEVAQEAPSAPVDLLSVAATTTVAVETEAPPAVPSTPAPTGPPAVPSTPAPTGPPAVPSTPAPTGPPAVPSTPAPTGPPAGPPSEPPSSSPAGPPSGPPSSSPAGPPSGPPSSPPAGPPSGPPSGPPAGPPSGPPAGPPSSPPSGPPSGPPSSPPSRPNDL